MSRGRGQTSGGTSGAQTVSTRATAGVAVCYVYMSCSALYLMQGQLRNDARGFVPSSRSTTRSESGRELQHALFAGPMRCCCTKFCCLMLDDTSLMYVRCTLLAAACIQPALLLSDASVSGGKGSKLSLAAVNAAPFVPSNKAQQAKAGGGASESGRQKPALSGEASNSPCCILQQCAGRLQNLLVCCVLYTVVHLRLGVCILLHRGWSMTY